jgi:hypothetical protein
MNVKRFAQWPQALALAGMVSSLCAASAWGAAGDNGQYFMIEGLYLEKDNGDTVALTAPDGAGAFNLVTDDVLELDSSGGARATAQFAAFGHTWQASAFGVASFDQDFLVSNLDTPSNNTSTTYAEFVGGSDPSVNEPFNSDQVHALDLNLEADLYGAEFSWVKNLGGYGWNNVDLLVGIRYIHYGEELTSIAFDEANDLAGTDNEIDRAFIGVDNDLVGLQIGLQGMWSVASNVSIGGSLKGGIAANFVDRERSFASDNLNYPAYANSHDDTGFAEFAEFNPRIDITLSDTATLTIGGTVLWINETSHATSHYQALADATDGNVRADDDELFYGASIGLKLALN